MHALYRNHLGSDLEVAIDARISFDATTKAASWINVDIPADWLCPNATQASFRRPGLSLKDKQLIEFLARGCRSGDWEGMIEVLGDSQMTLRERRELLNYVKRMPTHFTPFAQQNIKLRMKAPVPIRTQSFKSKIGFVENEESRRYIKSEPEIFIPEYRLAPEEDIKQGSGGPHPDNAYWQEEYRKSTQAAVDLYMRQIKAGVAPEQARFSLPQGAYVNWVWNGSLYAYAEFFNKRNDGHAQGEIQVLANEVAKIAKLLFPVSWAALTEDL